MVKQIVFDTLHPYAFQCEACEYVYASEETAAQCQAWCTERQSCNLEITQHALKKESIPK